MLPAAGGAVAEVSGGVGERGAALQSLKAAVRYLGAEGRVLNGRGPAAQTNHLPPSSLLLLAEVGGTHPRLKKL